MAQRSAIAKINNANYLPKRLLGKGDEVKDLALGTLVGVATGLFKSTNPATGEEFEGIKGTFEYTDFDKERDILISGKLFLPGGIDEMVKEALEQADGGSVRFAFEVGVMRASNAAGYSWKFSPLTEPEANDPLAELRSLVDDRHALPKPDAVKSGDKEGEAPKAEAKEKAKA